MRPNQTRRSVAVISSVADLHRAVRLRRPPDLFELRLDALCLELAEVERAIGKLAAPLVMTARHPLEGGAHALTAVQRRNLLSRFLPDAEFVDIELRAASQLHPVLEIARDLEVKRIISVHEFARCPTPRRLRQFADKAAGLNPDVFKIAIQTATAQELDRLLAFFDETKRRMPISAMGMGRLGHLSRVLLARRGSALQYAHLGVSQTNGQLSLAELRRIFDRSDAPARPTAIAPRIINAVKRTR